MTISIGNDGARGSAGHTGTTFGGIGGTGELAGSATFYVPPGDDTDQGQWYFLIHGGHGGAGGTGGNGAAGGQSGLGGAITSSGWSGGRGGDGSTGGSANLTMDTVIVQGLLATVVAGTGGAGGFGGNGGGISVGSVTNHAFTGGNGGNGGNGGRGGNATFNFANGAVTGSSLASVVSVYGGAGGQITLPGLGGLKSDYGAPTTYSDGNGNSFTTGYDGISGVQGNGGDASGNLSGSSLVFSQTGLGAATLALNVHAGGGLNGGDAVLTFTGNTATGTGNGVFAVDLSVEGGFANSDTGAVTDAGAGSATLTFSGNNLVGGPGDSLDLHLTSLVHDAAAFTGLGAVYINLASSTLSVGGQSNFLTGVENVSVSVSDGYKDFNDVFHEMAQTVVVVGDYQNNIFAGGATEADSFDGGDGSDTMSYARAGSAVTVSLALQGSQQDTIGAGLDTLSHIENLIGSAYDDTLTGDSGNNSLEGGDGNDILDGGAGQDIAAYASAGAAVSVSLLAQGAAQDTGGGGLDTLSHVEGLLGSAYDDILTGDDGDNVLDGGSGGDDILIGGAGNNTAAFTLASGTVSVSLGLQDASQDTGAGGHDTLSGFVNLTGGAFDDTLTGDGNANILDGGDGSNTLIGGAGDDIYIFRNGYNTVVEAGGGGTDTVIAMVGQANLGDQAANVENLILSGGASMGTGNGLDNVITGNNSQWNTLFGGDGNDTLLGGHLNDTLYGGAGNDTMRGGAGNDIYDVSSAGDIVDETLGGIDQGGIDKVFSAISYVLPNFVEYLDISGGDGISGGDDNGTGNGLDNVVVGSLGNNILLGLAGNDQMHGYDGNDRLDGGTGSDWLWGGTGDDTYVVDTAGDLVTESAGEGTDTVIASVSYILGQNVENLTLTGTANRNGYGNELDNVIIGNSGVNGLKGYDGKDTLDGGLGADILTGGNGDDTYYVDNAGDIVTESSGQGTDRVCSALAGYSLGSNVENLTLLGSGNLNGTGNSLVNIITGNAGNNILDGGTGADTMTGGLGNDTYVVDTAGDVVVENTGEGTDTVIASISYVLAANFENLTLTGILDRSGYGNAADNILTGNSGNNSLKGYDGNDKLDGGAGNDTLAGGIGDDSYYVDATGDVVVESVNQGVDKVYSTASAYSLGQNVESLTLMGNGNINGTGNALANIITGNSADNVLDGGGGVDTLVGGQGNDTYYVTDSTSIVTERSGEGNDTIYASVTYSLLGRFVETLILTGANAIDATGNSEVNSLYGNSASNTLNAGAGNDILDGGGGADTLIGGQGDDTFYVDNSGDLITEYSSQGSDTVHSTLAAYALAGNCETLILDGAGNSNGTGNSLANSLVGNAGNNVLNGGIGADTLSGGQGADVFLFTSSSGADTISDFASAQGDMININAFSHGVVHAGYLHQVGGDTTIDMGGGNIVTVLASTVADVSAHIIW